MQRVVVTLGARKEQHNETDLGKCQINTPKEELFQNFGDSLLMWEIRKKSRTHKRQQMKPASVRQNAR